jgi:uncharacterized protein YjbI with pentapeptide repeats
MKEQTKTKLTIEEIIAAQKKDRLGPSRRDQFDFSQKDLSGLDLSNTELSSLSFFVCDFSRVNLTGSNMIKFKLLSSDLFATSFKKSFLNDADLNDSKVSQTNFTDAVMINAECRYINGDNPIFVRADLTGAKFIGAKILGANFSYAKLIGVQFNNANLSGANFSYADLSDADLLFTSFSTPANFNSANLTRATLSGLNLANSNFENANLTDSNLSFAHLDNANFTNANFTNANLVGANLQNATLTGAKFNGVIRRAFSLDFKEMRDASSFFYRFLDRKDLTIDQKKQMLEIDETNPDKPRISKYIEEKRAIIFDNKNTGISEKKEFEKFLTKIKQLEDEYLGPVVEQRPPMFAEEESEEHGKKKPSAVLNSGKRKPEGNPVDNEIKIAAKILVNMKNGVHH